MTRAIKKRFGGISLSPKFYPEKRKKAFERKKKNQKIVYLYIIGFFLASLKQNAVSPALIVIAPFFSK